MLPPLIALPDYEFQVLPTGIHEADLPEVEVVFAFNSWRRALF